MKIICLKLVFNTVQYHITAVMVITGTGFVLKVVSGSPVSVNFPQSLLERDTKPLIAVWLPATRPTLHARLSADSHTYADEPLYVFVQSKCHIPVYHSMVIINIKPNIEKKNLPMSDLHDYL